MSQGAKICFGIAFLCMVVLAAFQVMAGGWVAANWFLLTGAVGLIALAIFLDAAMYWEFLTMRTTKHGMNMGVMILLAVTTLVCINYLGYKHNKTWDLTEERLNSLSEQTTKLLDGLTEDLYIKVFYKGAEIGDLKGKIKQALGIYQEYSKKVKVEFINVYVEQVKAHEYLLNQADIDQAKVMVFLDYKTKRVRIDDVDEAGVTAAIIKATRESATKIYLVQGHGEKDMSSDDDQGIQQLVKNLTESSFQIEPLNLLDRKEVPADAGAVAIIGPQMPYLENEVQALRAYLNKGGRVFVAIDPGLRHGLAGLVKTMGAEFSNNYVFSLTQIQGQGPATIVGRRYDPASEITRSIPAGSYTMFPLASEMKAAGDKNVEVRELVKSDDRSFTVTDPTKPVNDKPKMSAVVIALDVKGLEEGKKFQGVIFGDSDFLTNRALMFGANRDLAMNAFAQLTDQNDLISIKPKMPKGTMVMLTQVSRLAIIIGLMALPVVLLITSGVLWFRRRGA